MNYTITVVEQCWHTGYYNESGNIVTTNSDCYIYVEKVNYNMVCENSDGSESGRF